MVHLDLHLFQPSGPGNPVDEEITEVSRLLERLLKESRCLDMESLCISAEEKVWYGQCSYLKKTKYKVKNIIRFSWCILFLV